MHASAIGIKLPKNPPRFEASIFLVPIPDHDDEEVGDDNV